MAFQYMVGQIVTYTAIRYRDAIRRLYCSARFLISGSLKSVGPLVVKDDSIKIGEYALPKHARHAVQEALAKKDEMFTFTDHPFNLDERLNPGNRLGSYTANKLPDNTWELRLIPRKIKTLEGSVGHI